MKVTVHDVAKIAKTSSATVSRVVSGGANVSRATKETVLRAIEECGYIPRQKSKCAKQTNKDTVLVIVEDLELVAYLDYIKGMTNVLAAGGKTVFVYSSDYDPQKEVKSLQFAESNKYCGVIMLSAIENPALLKAIEEVKIPVVFANRYLRSVETDTVTLDNYKLGYMATNELIRRGHKKIAHLAGSRTSNASLDRIRGYKDAMETAKFSAPQNAIFYGDLKYEGGVAFADWLLKEKMPFTAVFASNETMSMGLIETLEDHNVSCPDCISVICAIHTNMVRVGKIKLTGFGYGSIEMGEKAANLLLQRLEEPNGKKMHIAFTPELMENNSIKNI